MILVAVQGSIRLESVTARAWLRFVGAVKAAHGVALTISSPAGGYRSEAMVMDMWRNPAKYKATKGVARPISLGGPGSVHQSGRCVDIWNHALVPRKSLVSLARKYGFIFTIPVEPWHVWHDGTAVGGGTAGGGVSIIEPEEEPMAVLVTAVQQKDKPSFLVAPNFMHRITSAELGALREATDLVREDKSDADFMNTVRPFGFEHLTLAEIAAIPIGATYRGTAPAPAPAIDYAALAAAIAPLIPAPATPPTVDEIAAEVIRQQKLPGN